ncbi:ABC transporter ATP-binding protein [Microtetraspora fusca]|uniref:ABC transporter ATP-binding protein n=1 Tax=Microtetraspora fusca TaxID=1997 RepID=UPI000A00F7CF|nr:oligopeptide/dipeptide ABC transporter ATP-binding protein [Microtetraspora fusca]
MAGTGSAHMRSGQDRVLVVDNLVVEYPAGRGQKVHAVSGVSFDLLDGETLGILGESGCGKSSAGRAVMQLPPPTSGSVRLDGAELTGLAPRALRTRRRKMQMILQDPVSSLNPRRRVRDLVAEGPSIWGTRPARERIESMISSVGLDPAVVWDRRPHELSGGQCQRICIARALMLDPRALICDEPVSSLDVSVQAQILNLLEETKTRYGLSMVFIAHDLAVVKNISDRIMVMYLGKVCEVTPSARMSESALHPYTRLLLASVPEADLGPGGGIELTTGEAGREAPGDAALALPGGTPGGLPDVVPVLSGGTAPAWPGDAGPAVGRARTGGRSADGVGDGAIELPSPLNPPSGCRFRTRCPLATARCADEEPLLRQVGDGHYLACHNVGD